MGGAYIKLMIKGQQDEFLTTEGTKNFFVKSYEKFIDFSVEQIKVYFNEDVNFGKKITLNFPRSGDLLHKTYFCFKLPALTYTSGSYAGWTNNIGHAIIDYIDLEIGTKLISRYYGIYMDIWEELTGLDNKENSMIGKYSNAETLEASGLVPSEYVVPLPFWFCKGIYTALPIIALLYHQVRLVVKLKDFSQCVIYDGASPPLAVRMDDAYILSDYIFIDEGLKLQIKSKTHQILIEQVQYKDTQGSSSNGVFKTNLPFNHPVKELMWVFIEEDSITNNDWFNFSTRNLIPFTKVYSLMKNAKLSVEGKDYTEVKDEIVLRLINNHRNKPDRHIYTIPFCSEPEEWEPSGSLNFSKIDSVDLYGEMRTPSPLNMMYIFATNYNWMTFQNGLSSLMFIT